MKSAFLFLSTFNIARVMLYYFTPQHVPVDVGIYFGGGNGFVSEHTLDGTEIGPSFQQMSGERVAKSVRTDVLGDTCGLCQFLDEMEHHDA